MDCYSTYAGSDYHVVHRRSQTCHNGHALLPGDGPRRAHHEDCGQGRGVLGKCTCGRSSQLGPFLDHQGRRARCSHCGALICLNWGTHAQCAEGCPDWRCYSCWSFPRADGLVEQRTFTYGQELSAARRNETAAIAESKARSSIGGLDASSSNVRPADVRQGQRSSLARAQRTYARPVGARPHSAEAVLTPSRRRGLLNGSVLSSDAPPGELSACEQRSDERKCAVPSTGRLPQGPEQEAPPHEAADRSIPPPLPAREPPLPQGRRSVDAEHSAAAAEESLLCSADRLGITQAERNYLLNQSWMRTLPLFTASLPAVEALRFRFAAAGFGV